jgi:type I restriction enzyme, R subunit
VARAAAAAAAVPCVAAHCMTRTGHTSSFAFLAPYGPLYLQLATVAESALALDPSLTLLKLRQLAEVFAQRAASSAGLADANQHDLLRLLEQRGIVTDHIAEVFHMLRRAGNRAAHDFVGTHQDALSGLRIAHDLGRGRGWRSHARADPRAGPSSTRPRHRGARRRAAVGAERR